MKNIIPKLVGDYEELFGFKKSHQSSVFKDYLKDLIEIPYSSISKNLFIIRFRAFQDERYKLVTRIKRHIKI